MTPTNEAERVALLLERFDAAAAKCPYKRPNAPNSRDDCPKCGANASGGCRVQNLAAYDFIEAVRQFLSKEADDGE